MNVKELITILNGFPQDTDIILSIDSEGNKFSPLDGCDPGRLPDCEVGNRWIDSYYSDAHSDSDCGLEPGERETLTKVICLWPRG